MQLPTDFVEMLRGYGDDYAEPLLAALGTPASVSVRANPSKGASPLPGADCVPWCPMGFYLPERPLFAADPAWHQGLYYVQDASSMIYGEAVRRITGRYFTGRKGLRYLDACAAPGGKSISAAEALPDGSLVVSNELDRHRANILAENIGKYGRPDFVVCRGDAARFGSLREAFDIIAVDAPCSGEGMMRKEPEAVRQWSPALIDRCADVQRTILESLWPALKPGGVLIYSTCTFNRSENEENIAFAAGQLGGESIDLGLDEYGGVVGAISSPYHAYRLAPGHIRGEGLFIGALRKPGESDSPESDTRVKAPGDYARKHVLDCSRYAEVKTRSGIELLPAAHAAFIADLARKTDLIRAGVTVAVEKGRDLVPTHDFALSTAVNPQSFPQLDLDYSGALAYLRGESLSDIPETLPRGFVLVCYGGRPLGFVKNIGRRANNLCPDALRLRLDPRYLPAEAPQPLISLK